METWNRLITVGREEGEGECWKGKRLVKGHVEMMHGNGQWRGD